MLPEAKRMIISMISPMSFDQKPPVLLALCMAALEVIFVLL
jgi:hypothetical protein